MSIKEVMHVFGDTEDFPDYPATDLKDYTVVTIDGTDTYMVYGGTMVSLDGSDDSDSDPDNPLPNRGSEDRGSEGQ